MQHIVFSAFFGMPFASSSHGEHISFSVYQKYQTARVTADVCSTGTIHALLATLLWQSALQTDCLKIMT